MNALAGRTAEALCLEACALGDEAIRIATRAHAKALDDPGRWELSMRLWRINQRLKQITKEVAHENRALQKHRI